MAIYLCYGCDEYKDSDDGSYESIEAKKSGKFEDCCIDCHDSELLKNVEKCMACELMSVVDNECLECGAKSVSNIPKEVAQHARPR